MRKGFFEREKTRSRLNRIRPESPSQDKLTSREFNDLLTVLDLFHVRQQQMRKELEQFKLQSFLEMGEIRRTIRDISGVYRRIAGKEPLSVLNEMRA